MKVEGKIIWYSKARLIGTIIGVDCERFFFHVSNVLKGPEVPEIGSLVCFEISSQQPKENRLRTAIHIDIAPKPVAQIGVVPATETSILGVK